MVQIYYSIDACEHALQQKRRLAFYYFDLNEKLERNYRKNKKRYDKRGDKRFDKKGGKNFNAKGAQKSAPKKTLENRGIVGFFKSLFGKKK